MLRRLQMRWSGHLERMDEERLSKRLSYGDDTLKKSLKQLQINPVTWEDLTQDRLARRRSVKTGSAIYEAKRIATAKAKRAARNSRASRTNNVDAQTLPTCPHCHRTMRARIGLVGHLRTKCTKSPTIQNSMSTSANSIFDSPTLTPLINSISLTIIETTSKCLARVSLTTLTTTATTTPTISDGDSLLNCLHCDRTFTSRIGLVGHLRIHRTETGEPVPGASTHSRDRRLLCPHCPRAVTHRMILFGHMRIHDSGIHRNADNTDTPCTPSAPTIFSAPATPTSMNDIHPASSDFSCPPCARKFNSRIGLIGHLRIQRMEAVEPLDGTAILCWLRHLDCALPDLDATHPLIHSPGVVDGAATGLLVQFLTELLLCPKSPARLNLDDADVLAHFGDLIKLFSGDSCRVRKSLNECCSSGIIQKTLVPCLLRAFQAASSTPPSALPNGEKMAAHSQLQLNQHGVDAEDSGPLQDFRVRDPVLPPQLQYSREAVEMEIIQLPGLVRGDGSGLRSVNECRQDGGLGSVDREEQVMDCNRRHVRWGLRRPVSSVGDADPRALIMLGVHQHSREDEAEQGGNQYAALLHSVGHCECSGYGPVVSDARHHPVMKLTHHVLEPLRLSEFLRDFPQSVAIHRDKGIRQIHEGSVKVSSPGREGGRSRSFFQST
ncbi:unnamed protein product [Schistocephalus solidus]|uniref:C2H2-type domain-containing protein n=1 Tax=Schistocephalus solidus TaxID=70667 RepID=A0A183SCZ1_SCHSO|nr:unnamed protein product [Schistocephalus solidus]